MANDSKMKMSRRFHKFANCMDNIWDVKPCNCEVDKTTNKR